ncbi:hypothetical protein JCGZ_12080 [Jatropha curcas]|uniref:RRP15-like protein n=1 Tax=Jatropha curcas TaxID=180498 RepID=A0A067KCR9_JATCU|nr:uncharacterized protein LOC105638922 [Jatropha curcas]KDP32788.1 hypothetical protein JCGZ_12080 [Jatropha curcas]
MGGHRAIEAAKTVIEVADVAWKAMEFTHNHHHNQTHENHDNITHASIDEELESLRSENRCLKLQLEQNLKLLQNLSESPCLLNDCPPDLHARLVATVDSEDFLARLKSLQLASANISGIEFPFKEATGDDMHSAEMLINVSNEEPSWWVWVTEEMAPNNIEERSRIDNENYVVVTEEHVVDAVANFMAKCILSNPKAQKMTPEELQKSLEKALEGVSKWEKILNIWHAGQLFYTLATWGLALWGLYRTRSILKLAAKGVHKTSKVVLKAL